MSQNNEKLESHEVPDIQVVKCILQRTVLPGTWAKPSNCKHVISSEDLVILVVNPAAVFQSTRTFPDRIVSAYLCITVSDVQ